MVERRSGPNRHVLQQAVRGNAAGLPGEPTTQPAPFVECGAMGTTSAQTRHEGGQASGVLMLQVVAVTQCGIRTDQVKRALVSSTAHGNICPFSVNAVVHNSVDASGGGALGLVPSKGIAPVKVAVL